MYTQILSCQPLGKREAVLRTLAAYATQKYFIPEGYTVKYNEGNNVSDRVSRIDLVIDISWRVGLQKAYCPFRLNLSYFFLVDRFT